MNLGHARPPASRLLGMKSTHPSAQNSAVLSLPPCVGDDRHTLADDHVVPLPHCRFDGLAHGGHMLEVVMVLLRLVRPGAPKRPYCGRRGMKDIDVKFFGDAPRTPSVGIGG